MKKALIKICCFLVFAIMLSCNSRSNNVSEDQGSTVAGVNVDSITINVDGSEKFLNSYSLSAYEDSSQSLYCYNHKSHAVDIINLKDKSVDGSIKLEMKGPDAISPQVLGIKVIAPDSIAIYDGTSTINILNKSGKITKKIKLPTEYYCDIESNSRVKISDFDIDFNENVIKFPIRENGLSNVIVYDFETDSVLRQISLNKPAEEGSHGFMQSPNVSYNGDLVIYNYPFESEIHIYDLDSDTTYSIHPISNFVDDKMPIFKGNSFDEATWYSYKNFFHSSIYYLEDDNIYARITLGPAEQGINDDEAKAMFSRKAYIMFFDAEFKPIKECELPQFRYNNFGGWVPTTNAVAFFVDNIFSPVIEDHIMIDIVN